MDTEAWRDKKAALRAERRKYNTALEKASDLIEDVSEDCAKLSPDLKIEDLKSYADENAPDVVRREYLTAQVTFYHQFLTAMQLQRSVHEASNGPDTPRTSERLDEELAFYRDGAQAFEGMAETITRNMAIPACNILHTWNEFQQVVLGKAEVIVGVGAVGATAAVCGGLGVHKMVAGILVGAGWSAKCTAFPLAAVAGTAAVGAAAGVLVFFLAAGAFLTVRRWLQAPTLNATEAEKRQAICAAMEELKKDSLSSNKIRHMRDLFTEHFGNIQFEAHSSEECAICLEEFGKDAAQAVRSANCSGPHFFHPACLSSVDDPRCPTCRQ